MTDLLSNLSTEELNEAAIYFHGRQNHKACSVLFEGVLQRDPGRFDVLANLGSAYLGLGLLKQAREILLLSIKLNAVNAGSWFNLGMLCRQEGRFEDERTCIEIAMGQGATNLNDLMWAALAHNSQYFGKDEQAIEEYRRSVEIAPDNYDRRMSIGILQMKLGNWSEGLANYEYRLKPHPIKWASDSIMKWDADYGFYPNRRVLVCTEQGTGDTFQYARYGAALKQLFKADHVALFCPDNLVSIMSKWPGWNEIIPHSSEFLPDFDIQIAMMSIPLVLQQRGVDFFVPEASPILDFSVDSRRDCNGLCWRGNADHPNDKFRSANIHDVLPITTVGYEVWFSMQYGMTDEEISIWGRSSRNDLSWAESATWMKNYLKLLVTCDTAVAHLAGSLGIPTWILLPLNSDFRWGVGSDTTPWYKSVRLFRQKKLGEWGPVIEKVKEELKKL